MDYPHGKFLPTTAETQYRHKVFAQLWAAVNEDVDADDENSDDALAAKDWLEYRGFHYLMGEGHCFRCHGFEGEPCEKPEGHGAFACPGCVQENREHKAAVEATMLLPSQPIHLENGDVLYPYTIGGDK